MANLDDIFGESMFSYVDPQAGTATSFYTVLVQDGNDAVARTSILQDSIHDHVDNEQDPVHLALTNVEDSQTYQANENGGTEVPTVPDETETNVLPNRVLGISRPLRINAIRNKTAPRLSILERFKNALERFGAYFNILDNSLITSNPSIRVVHVLESNWTFAMLTALVSNVDRRRSTASSDRDINAYPFVQPFGGIIWQTSTSSPKAVSITLSYDMESEDTNRSGFCATCSCMPTLKVFSLDDSSCEHVKAVLQNTSVPDLFRSTIFQGCHGAALNKFGTPIREHSDFPIIHFVQFNSVQPLRTEGRQTPHWSFYSMFDTTRLLFVPLVLVKHKKIQCLMCRGHRSRRGACPHEIAWENEMYGNEDEEENAVFNMNDSDLEDTDPDDDGPIANDAFEGQNRNNPRRNEALDPEPLDPTHRYCRTNLKLPLLPCKGIRYCSYYVARMIELDKGQGNFTIYDEQAVCPHCKRPRSPALTESCWIRSTRLYTLTQQVRQVKIEDWQCSFCSKRVYFTGVGVAIFPVRKTYCFTYELLYHFIHGVCRLGISFRAIYDTYYMTQVALSTKAKYADFNDHPVGNGIILEDCVSGRRRCSEAFRSFLHCIDTNNPDMCKVLFTCTKCEVELSADRKRLLGYPRNHSEPIKAFKAMAFDGTSAGILHSLPSYHRNPVCLPVPNQLRTKQRFITSKIFHTALATLLKVTRHRLRIVLNKSKRLPTGVRTLSFAVPTKKAGKGGNKKNMVFKKEVLACLKALLCGTGCFCSEQSEGPTATTTNSSGQRGRGRGGGRGRRRRKCSDFCLKIKRAYRTQVRGDATIELLRSVITLENREVSDEPDDEEENEEEERVTEDIIDVENFYQNRNTNNVPSNSSSSDESDDEGEEESDDNGDESNEGDVENISSAESSEHTSDSDSDDDYNPDADESRTRANTRTTANIRTRRSTQSGTNPDTTPNPPSPERKWFITINIPQPISCGQLIESILDMIELLMTDNICLSYIRPCPESTILYPDDPSFQDAMDQRSQTLFTNSGTLKLDSRTIGYDSIRSHETLVRCMELISECECTGNSTGLFACHRCIQRMARATVLVSETNPIVSRFTDQLLLSIRQLGSTYAPSLFRLASIAIKEHIVAAQTYFTIIADHLSDECKEYWREYASTRLEALRFGEDEVNNEQTEVETEYEVAVTTNNTSTDPTIGYQRISLGNQSTAISDTQPQPSIADDPPQQITNRRRLNDVEEYNNNERVGGTASHQSISSIAGQSTTSEEGEQQQTPEYRLPEDAQDDSTTSSRVPDYSVKTGMSFPGRRQYRPLFVFDQLEGKQCGKRYAKNSTHSPGLLTAQCVCSNPKLIGFFVMTRAESTALALSMMVMFFQVPPLVLLYDNACNTIASALLRIPWLLLFSFLVVDRFHYKGHTCNAFYDADRYRRLDGIKTSSAESINAKIKRGLFNMRFLKGDVLVFYLNIRFALINLIGLHFERKGSADVEDVDLNKFYSDIVPCNCRACILKVYLQNRVRERDPEATIEIYPTLLDPNL